MASQGVSGKTQAQVEELRHKYRQKFGGEPPVPFSQQYCLASIPRQPDDYDGPERYCANQETYQLGDNYICPYHGGDGSTDEIEDDPGIQHGMYATRENLIADFDTKDQAVYDWVMDAFPDAYDIDLEAEPAARYDLHRLATEIVRAERGRGHVISEGEVREDPVRNEDGQVVLDNSGEIVTEKSEHYLAQMMYRQDNKITKLEKELGISRKERLRRADEENKADAIAKGLSELGKAFIGRDEQDYDPEKEPWADND